MSHPFRTTDAALQRDEGCNRVDARNYTIEFGGVGNWLDIAARFAGFAVERA